VLAQRLGLAPSVVERAVQLAGGGGGQVADMLDKLQTLREGLEEDRREVQRSKHDVERSRQLLEDQRKNEKLSADRRIERAAATALAELQDLARELEAARQALLHADRKQVEQLAKTVSDKQVRAQQVQLEASARLTGKPQRSGVTLADVLPGVLLWHTGLQRLVEVTEVQASSGRIRVRAGVLETACTLADLAGLLAEERQRQHQTGKNPSKPADTNRKPDRRAEPNPPTGGAMAFATMPAPELPEESLHLRTAERTVDLRGQRVDAAVDLLDAFLDRAARQGAPGICVVHGMGTGAVRDAVRQHLKGHPHVGRFRTGERGEGGDGATLVWLKDD
jgi:DNA mismatch repair protein MutS2